MNEGLEGLDGRKLKDHVIIKAFNDGHKLS